MKTKFKAKKLLSILFALPAATVFPLSSCGLEEKWDWKTSTNNSTELNYCLLIGQNDHPDSIERTRYTRKALDTYDEAATKKVKNNANVAKPKIGSLPRDPNDPTKGNFKVTELEHMEQKSMSGAAWDPITANSSASAWVAKHGKKITFFVSNNDSMAEGAQWAANWIKGLPIFGYDANASTIKMIKAGYITGTVDQNASIQCSTAMMMLRNMLDDWAKMKAGQECHNFGQTSYTPIYDEDFYNDDGHIKEEEYSKRTYGYVSTFFHTDSTTMTQGSERQALVKSTAIAAVKSDDIGWAYNNIGYYLRPDGEAKQPSDMFDIFTHVKNNITGLTHYKVCQTYANKAETYLVSTLRPYFNEYAKRLGLDLEIVEGDGTGEETIINQIKSKPDDKFDAYLINMAKTTATSEYITTLAQKACMKEKGTTCPENGWTNFNDRLNTPIIFYNRQPQNDNGAVDIPVMNNNFFKYTYFVGVDAPAGGEVQGQMIVNILRHFYKTMG